MNRGQKLSSEPFSLAFLTDSDYGILLNFGIQCVIYLLNTSVRFGGEQWASKYDIVNKNIYCSIEQLSNLLTWHYLLWCSFSSKEDQRKGSFPHIPILQSLISSILLRFLVNELMPPILTCSFDTKQFEKFKRHNISLNFVKIVFKLQHKTLF